MIHQPTMIAQKDVPSQAACDTLTCDCQEACKRILYLEKLRKTTP